MSEQIVDNEAERRYEIHVDGVMRGFVAYEEEPAGVRALVRTEVLPGSEGAGMGGRLVLGTFALLREQGHQMRPVCPFVAKTVQRNPEFETLVAAQA